MNWQGSPSIDTIRHSSDTTIMPSTASPLGSRTSATGDARPVLGHVNLMVDTLIANANLEDLRAIVRGMLATNPPSVAQAFTTAARQRLVRVDATAIPDTTGIFDAGAGDRAAAPTEKLHDILVRIRTLYGSGLGFASLRIIARIVSATVGIRWEDNSDMEDVLANIDADVSQAIQSSKEELDGGRVMDLQDAREIVQELRSAVNESQMDVKKWDGVFPFERAASSLHCTDSECYEPRVPLGSYPRKVRQIVRGYLDSLGLGRATA